MINRLTCPKCGASNLKGGEIVEDSVRVHNKIVSCPKTGLPKVRRTQLIYDNATTALICPHCGEESPLVAVDYDIAKK